jgi:hypothetical protein
MWALKIVLNYVSNKKWAPFVKINGKTLQNSGLG